MKSPQNLIHLSPRLIQRKLSQNSPIYRKVYLSVCLTWDRVQTSNNVFCPVILLLTFSIFFIVTTAALLVVGGREGSRPSNLLYFGGNSESDGSASQENAFKNSFRIAVDMPNTLSMNHHHQRRYHHGKGSASEDNFDVSNIVVPPPKHAARGNNDYLAGVHKDMNQELSSMSHKLQENPRHIIPAALTRKSTKRPNTLKMRKLAQHHSEFNVVGGLPEALDLYRPYDSHLKRDVWPNESLRLGRDTEFDLFPISGVGEYGAAVKLAEGREEEDGKLVRSVEAFNLVASNKVSVHRSVPDTRNLQCQMKFNSDIMNNVDNAQQMPTASIVIIFNNEAWTPLLRTIWSVLDRTPPELLHEIILVDDFSDKEHLQGQLENYLTKRLPSKVRLKRLTKRSGLIKARLVGASLASGDVLVFLDSHCECGYHWMEPLLLRIQQDPTVFAVPIIDVIDDNTFEYYHDNGNYFQVGGFTWSGHFTWVDLPHREAQEMDRDPTAAVPSPTMAGGLFAVNRDFFWYLGSYDERMEVWGGENLEMSFRIWQCGGRLEILPCSRVGHIFRNFHPYSFPGNKDTHGLNTVRTVEVWMDEFRKLFYIYRPELKGSIDKSTLVKRLQFRSDRHCHSFSWFLDNIFPSKYVPSGRKHVIAYGRVRNPHTNICLDTLLNDKDASGGGSGNPSENTYDLGVYICHDIEDSNYISDEDDDEKGPLASQFLSYSRHHHQLRKEDNCAEISDMTADVTRRSGYKIVMLPCTKNPTDDENSDHIATDSQHWTLGAQGHVIHTKTGLCLDLIEEAANNRHSKEEGQQPLQEISTELFAEVCIYDDHQQRGLGHGGGGESQQFYFDTYYDDIETADNSEVDSSYQQSSKDLL